jgi:aminopeptidase N
VRVPVAPYRFANSVIRLRFDVPRGIVYGDETVTILPKAAGLTNLPFDSVGIHYEGIILDGKPARFHNDPVRERITVHVASPTDAGRRLDIEFRYWTKPQGGIYFVRPDAAYPRLAPEIWSQGEPTDNRRWFPTWDEPNEKTPSELIVTVPRGWTVIANGYLKADAQTASGEVWDWNSPKPKSTYLISFAAGPLVRHHTLLGHLDVDSFVQPQYAPLNSVCFHRTKDIIAYFQHVIGVPFPWEKYDQTTAERYVFGGMEDVSATLLTTRALHPATEEPEDSCDTLVAHELAQQWWGDDATMSDWANVWLHEGFATYYDELWSGHIGGEAEFEYRRYQAQQIYFAETRQYLRPIVDPAYAHALDMFDASGHERPAEVLHMLRVMVGDQRFFAATRAYLREYALRNADTDRFFASIDRCLGVDLTWFEREWFYRDDYPHYDVTQRYDGRRHVVLLHVEQKNLGGKPYRMPIVIEAFFGTREARVEPLIDRNDQTVAMYGIASAPKMVLFDPDDNVLRQLTFPKPVDELAYQLSSAHHVGDREWALEQFAGSTRTSGATRLEVMRAVRRATLGDSFWGVRSDAAAFAAAFDDAATVDAALHDSDKRVRLAAEAASSKLSGRPAAVIADLTRLSVDRDPNVAAAAFTALGALKAPEAYDRLATALQRPTFRETVASGALMGLALYGDPRAIPLLQARTRYGTEEDERNVAIGALAILARSSKRPEAASGILQRLATSDPLIATRLSAVTALGMLGDAGALRTLVRVELSDPQLMIREGAARAIAEIKLAVRSLHTS